jgi:hypothetical protein
MFFYKIKKDTPIGLRVCNLFNKIEACHEAAEKTAKKIGAIAYLPDVNSDYGGISAIEFPENKKPGPEWERLPETDELKGSFYVPAIEVRTFTVPKEVISKYKFKNNYIISEKEFNFNEVKIHFSREEAASMAGIALITQPLERLAKKYGLSKQEVSMLMAGIPAYNVLKGQPNEVVAACLGSQKEDAEIEKKLSEKKFKCIQEIKGGPKALKIYNEISSLPVIPQGTFDHVLGIENSNQRPGITRGKDFFYCVTAKEIKGCEHISEKEWNESIKKSL